jgi:hypothetical protein
MPQEVTVDVLRNWLDILKESLNLRASNDNEYGIVIYPK